MQRTDRWQKVFSYRHSFIYGPGWRELTIGVFKITRQPEPGARIRRGDYRGFLWNVLIWLPWEFQR